MAQSPYIVRPSATQSPYVTRPSSSGGGSIGAGFFSLTGATLTDPNSVAQSYSATSNGFAIQLQNPAASRDLPNTGACWAQAGIVDVLGNSLTSPELPRHACIVHVMERQIPATTPNLMRIGFGFMNGSNPNTATAGVVWGIEYNATTLRRTWVAVITSAGTWTAATGGTGQATCFGCQGGYIAFNPTSLDEIYALPLDSTAELGTIGTNDARRTANISMSAMTHTFLFAGWQATGGNSGDTITFQPKYWMTPLTGRG